ncbi:hypothetical protein [Metapseudomonas resinovorans]|uniref:hypothetical protein n=1 Tax=Metapseudomonas resinovorans TaxID=53412 RepID=UPI00048FB427|nr:hypothetical protein [Pseudomonas resinovorans]MDE3739983.1 hypothetical protein [Pseudomonas resinovorans]
MSWLRFHQRSLLRMALVLWLLAFGVAASHGCLSYLPHDLASGHDEVSSSLHERSHQLHASGCLQFCEDGATALKLASGQVLLDQIFWPLLLLLPVALLPAVIPPRFAALAFHLPAPPRPPARLRFVRFND